MIFFNADLLANDADMHFELITELGRGGFGKVEEVTSNLSFNTYAVCTLPILSKAS
jgi:hypothetical protein